MVSSSVPVNRGGGGYWDKLSGKGAQHGIDDGGSIGNESDTLAAQIGQQEENAGK